MDNTNQHDQVKELTDRVRRLEQDLERAEQAGRVKSNYLENLSHDMRNAMNGIVGMTGLVSETDTTPEQEEYLEMIGSSVDRLLETVSEILDFSKIESGELELDFDDFNLKESLDHDLYLLQLAAGQKGMSLTCRIDPDVPEYLNGDPKRLVQVVTNLVNNAIKYTDGGKVSIKVQNDGYDRQNRLILSFSIHDTGKGISLEQQKRIFNAFCHEDAFRTVSDNGAGIGLALCAQLVKLMDGDIGLASSERGSVFWFSVPFKEVPELDIGSELDQHLVDRQAETATYALQGAKILLAEDEMISRVLTETLLTKAGVEVTSVENGALAVEAVQNGEYQVILMDVQMPVMDGFDATRRIRELEKGKGQGAVIIALTALAKQGDRERCLQAGMDDYLSKPIEKISLLEILTKYLTRTALVAENDIANQQLMVRSLVEKGWDVTIADTGKSALYEASLSNFDLILLDTAMDQVDGFEAARVIRQLEEYSGRQAVLVGIGTGDKGEREQCSRSGFDSYIARPVTRGWMDEVLDEIEF